MYYLVKSYNFDYDFFIIDILYKKQKLRYTEIQRILESKIRKTISPDTLSYHIKKLISRNYIKQSIVQGKRGKSKFYSLSEITRQDIQLGLLNINYD